MLTEQKNARIQHEVCVREQRTSQCDQLAVDKLFKFMAILYYIRNRVTYHFVECSPLERHPSRRCCWSFFCRSSLRLYCHRLLACLPAHHPIHRRWPLSFDNLPEIERKSKKSQTTNSFGFCHFFFSSKDGGIEKKTLTIIISIAILRALSRYLKGKMRNILLNLN